MIREAMRSWADWVERAFDRFEIAADVNDAGGLVVGDRVRFRPGGDVVLRVTRIDVDGVSCVAASGGRITFPPSLVPMLERV